MEWKTGKPAKDGVYYVKYKTTAFTADFDISDYYDIMTIPYTVEGGWCTLHSKNPERRPAMWDNVCGWAEVEVVA